MATHEQNGQSNAGTLGSQYHHHRTFWLLVSHASECRQQRLCGALRISARLAESPRARSLYALTHHAQYPNSAQSEMPRRSLRCVART